MKVPAMNYSSDHYNGKIFLNPVPTPMQQKGGFGRIMKKLLLTKHPGRTPDKPPGPFITSPSDYKEIPPGSLFVTWLGHSSTIIEIDGKRFLTDPLWYDRASPFSMIGPKRFFSNPLPFWQLPPIDAILLSHDHYDHLDKNAILKLAEKKLPVITMLGVGERLIKWGVDPSLVTELDWWQETTLDNIKITAAPARHFSGRRIKDRFHTLWGSFAIRGPQHNVYFGADSGYFEGFKTIGEKLGPFDLAMLEIGAYDEEWINIHMGPENAVQANIDVKGKLLMPLHWGTFNLAFHPWKEPVERVIVAAKIKSVPLLLPQPGEKRNIQLGAYNSGWWKKY
jgi:L-ascorbate metabolism protein UlaG (beta-lactamase superfamily)